MTVTHKKTIQIEINLFKTDEYIEIDYQNNL